MSEKPTYEELNERIRELEQSEIDSKRIEEKLQDRARELQIQNKELNCLFRISETMKRSEERSLAEILSDIVEIIPSAWQYPEITCARIALNGKAFETKNFMETAWKQDSDILIDSRVAGVLEVFYLKELPDVDEGPFLKTERLLIDTLAERIGRIIERKRTEEALQESEEKYRSMMESFIEPLYIGSQDFNIEYMNPAMTRLIGKDATGEKCYKTIYGSDSKCDWCKIDKVTKGESVEFNIKNPLNSRTYRVSNMPIHNKDGSISKMTIFRDITNYTQAIKDKEQIQTQLMQAQKMESIGKLAGGIAHDFNNMLSVILGYGEDLLNNLHATDPLHQSAREIVEAGKRSATLTRQLLAFSRRQTLQPEVVDLNVIVKNIENMINRILGEDIELKTLLAEDLAHVKVDPGQIEQVIMNLVVNARDAMPHGGKLTIELANIELNEQYAENRVSVTPGEYVILSLTDSGVGMDEETRTKIFEPFFTTKEKHKGTGLGLSTVYGIIKQSGGNIWVYSEPGHGTTFKIYLPKTIEAPKIMKTVRDHNLIIGRGEMILVVEDEPSLRKLCEKILKVLNYSVVVTANGGEALLVVEEQQLRPDLLITDVVMPEMSGKVLADRLKKTLPDLKILYMSGYTDNAIVHHGVLDSGTPFIQKPFTKSTLGKAIKSVLNETKE